MRGLPVPPHRRQRPCGVALGEHPTPETGQETGGGAGLGPRGFAPRQTDTLYSVLLTGASWTAAEPLGGSTKPPRGWFPGESLTDCGRGLPGESFVVRISDTLLQSVCARRYPPPPQPLEPSPNDARRSGSKNATTGKSRRAKIFGFANGARMHKCARFSTRMWRGASPD